MFFGKQFTNLLLDIEESLPEPHRTYAHLYYRENKTQKEIGAILGKSQGQVSRDLKRMIVHVTGRLAKRNTENIVSSRKKGD